MVYYTLPKITLFIKQALKPSPSEHAKNQRQCRPIAENIEDTKKSLHIQHYSIELSAVDFLQKLGEVMVNSDSGNTLKEFS